jgi:hypothetical protein
VRLQWEWLGGAKVQAREAESESAAQEVSRAA